MWDRPKHYNETDEWFSYFRMTKSLPGIPAKFRAEMELLPDAKAARTVLTAYAATALDISLFGGYTTMDKLPRELDMMFDLKPAHLMRLNVEDIAALIRHTDGENLGKKLTEAGFKIESKIITAFTPPAAPKPQPKPPVIYGPGF
ncbi:MAG: hypothetical protein ACAH80_15240 [Alphaproteobacteria bacterium]